MRHLTEMPQLKLGDISEWYSPIFKTGRVVKNNCRIINTIASILHGIMGAYFSADIIQTSMFSSIISSRAICSFLGTDTECPRTNIGANKLLFLNKVFDLY